MVIGIVIGIPAGVWAALHRNRWIDVAARLLSLVGLSFPVFVSGVFLLLAFALHWRVFPVIGNANLADPIDRLYKLVLPAITLGLVMAAYITRVTRSSMGLAEVTVMRILPSFSSQPARSRRERLTASFTARSMASGIG